MTLLAPQNGASPRGGVKRHPVGADWRCSCHGHERKKEKKARVS